MNLPRDKQFLCLTRGLPGSGKSTWALEQVANSKGLIVRVNRDAIRLTYGWKWEPKQEKLVMAARDDLINRALAYEKSVICDDTNLQSIAWAEGLAQNRGIEFIINDEFLAVSFEECVKRDLERPASVGKDVIEEFYARYWKDQPKPENYGKEVAILCDLDGTLALFPPHKNPYERDWSEDWLNEPVRHTLAAMRETFNNKIIIMSGRSEKYRQQTVMWLADKEVPYDDLFMRQSDDYRKDTIVKKEMYLENVNGLYCVRFVIDDRPSVVRMWRAECGLTVFQVGPNVEF